MLEWIVYAIFVFTIIWVTYRYFAYKEIDRIGFSLMLSAQPIQYKSKSKKHYLIIGDSTGVGVGVGESHRLGYKLHKQMKVNVENVAISGAMSKHLASQIKRAKRKKYDMIVLTIGTNDVFHLEDYKKTEKYMDSAIKKLKKLGPVLLVMHPNEALSPIHFWPARYFIQTRQSMIKIIWEKLKKKHELLYVNLFYDDMYESPFAQDSKKYFSKDFFHPSALGYDYAFKKIKEAIQRFK